MREVEVVERLNDYLDIRHVLYANEIRMGIGIPDIMIGFDVSDGHINIKDYYLLKTYELISQNEGQKVEDILLKSNIPKSTMKKNMSYLRSQEIINVIDSNIQIIKELDFNKIGVNISIEVKVKNWRMGLIQAQRYLSFSDYSYLALPVEHIGSIQEEEFFGTGIGLLSIGKNIVTEVIKPSKSNQCDNFFKYMSISSLLSSITLDNSKNDNFEETSLLWS